MCFLKFLHAPSTQPPTTSKASLTPFLTSTKPFSLQSPNQQQSQNTLKEDSLKYALLNCLKVMNLNSRVMNRLDDVVFRLFRNWKKVISFYIEVMIYFHAITASGMQRLLMFLLRTWRARSLRLKEGINHVMISLLGSLELALTSIDWYLLKPSPRLFIRIGISALRSS